MNESPWDDKLKAFLKKTGDDLKRAGGDIKLEAEKLMKEVKDPERQDKVKKGLESFRLWARKTAEEVAAVVETSVKKAESTVRSAVDPPPAPASTAPSPPPPAEPSEGTAQVDTVPMRHDTPVDTPAAAAKTIGASKKKKPASKAKAASKKPLGKKRTP